MDVALALMPAAGGPLAVTVTVALAVAVAPEELVTTRLYVVVDVGETACDPLTATAAPFSVALTALVEVHVSVELAPVVMLAGLAEIAAVGGGTEVTVTVALAVAVAPEELVTMRLYVVVDVGETACDPLTATAAPFSVALTALVEVHVSVELAPVVMLAGLAEIAAVGGGTEVTVTVALAVAVPPEELVTMSLYVVVAVGETACDPLTATVAPFSVALTALVEVHVSVELAPVAILVGFAEIVAVGGGTEVTVTVALAVAVAPEELVTTRLYVVVAVGETACDPLSATVAPFSVALTALVEVHVSVELAPVAILVGFAEIVAVGGGTEVTVTVALAVAVAPEELVTMRLYVVVAVGETACDPFTATVAPFNVALTALVEVHVSVELPPVAILVGFAEIVAVGALVTVMTTSPQSLAPDEL